jgi:hypothetical protein
VLVRFSSIAASSAFDNGGGVEGTKGTYCVVLVQLEPLRFADAIRSQQAMYSLLTQATIKCFFDVCIRISPVRVRCVVDRQPLFRATSLSDLADVRVEWVDEYIKILALQ